MISMELADLKLAVGVVTENSYFASAILEKANSPVDVVVVVYAGLPEASVRLTVAPETGTPETSCNVPVQEAEDANAIEFERIKSAAPSRRR